MRRSCQGVYGLATGAQKVSTTCFRLASLCYDGAPRNKPRLPADWGASPLSKEKAPGNKTQDAGLESGKTTQAERGRPAWPLLLHTGRRSLGGASSLVL